MSTINLLFSMLGPRLTEEQSDLFSQIGQWVVLNELGDRLFVDAIGPEAAIGWVLQTLAGAMARDPVVIGAWNFDGSLVDVYTLDEQAWLDVAPDLADFSDYNNPVFTRPLAFADVHQWQGWAEKQTAPTQPEGTPE